MQNSSSTVGRNFSVPALEWYRFRLLALNVALVCRNLTPLPDLPLKLSLNGEPDSQDLCLLFLASPQRVGILLSLLVGEAFKTMNLVQVFVVSPKFLASNLLVRVNDCVIARTPGRDEMG